MRLLEHQAKKLLSLWGIPVPRGAVCANLHQLDSALRKVAPFPVVLKAQVFAGGRGKAGGIVKVERKTQARKVAKRLLGTRLVTAQTGQAGVPVKALLLEQAVNVIKEFYIAILIDRSQQMPVVVAAREGGVAIEDLAKAHPDAIKIFPFDPFLGLLSHEAFDVVRWLGIPLDDRGEAIRQLKALAQGFFSCDATLVEINPWALTPSGLVALDAKVTLDDNALYRHPQFTRWKTQDADTPSEAKSKRIGINYVGLSGSIGCMVNGAGLAMATMDLIKLHGGEPANFLDVGGGADEAQVREAFKLILADRSVKAVLINIFGGIMKCDVIASGVVAAAKALKVRVPVVVRLEGTHKEEGKAILQASGLGFITANDMDEAARKAVEAARSISDLGQKDDGDSGR
jgi:succinyl-CoA synthetase beta subunit